MRSFFLLTAAFTALAEATAVTPTPIPEPASVTEAFTDMWMTDVFLADDEAYALDRDGTLWAWDYAAAPRAVTALPVTQQEQGYYDATGEAKKQLEESVFHIAAEGGAIWGLNPFSGRIGVIDAQGVHWSAEFDGSVLLQSSGWQYMWEDALVKDGVLYVLVSRWDERVKQVVRVDLTTGDMRLFDATDSDDDEATMAFQGDALLLACLVWNDAIMDYDEYYMTSVDLLTGERARRSTAFPEGRFYEVGLAATDEAAYLVANGNIYVSRGGSDFELLQNGPAYTTTLRCLPDGRLVYRHDGLHVMNLAAEPASEKLVIRGNLVDRGEVRGAFLSAHPEAQLQVVDGTLTPAEAADRIRTGDTETDIFCIRVDASYGALVDKGYAAPLDENAAIADSVSRMYPAIASVLTDAQGRVVAYPDSLWTSGYAVNMALWQRYFGDRPLPTTYFELFEAMRDFLALDNEEGDLFFDFYDEATMIQTMLRDYLMAQGDAATFDGPELTEALALLMEVQQTLHAMNLDSWDEVDLFPYADLYGAHSLIWHGGNYFLDRASLEATNDLSLTVGGEPMIYGRMSVMIVNPASRNQELAREYIAIWAQPAADSVRYAMLHTDAQPSKRTTRSGEEEWVVSPEGLSAWQTVAEQLRFGERTLLLGDRMAEQIAALSERCAAGQLPLDQCLAQLQEVAGMILSEQR